MERLDTGEKLDSKCHTCGTEIKNGIVGWSSGNHYCSFECLQKNGKTNNNDDDDVNTNVNTNIQM